MKSKTFINKITDSSVFWMVLSLLISLIMWTYLESRDIKPTDKILEGVKIEFVGKSEDMYVLDQYPLTVDFTVSGPSRLVSQLSADNVIARVNVSGLSAQVYNRSYSIILPDSLTVEEKAELQISFSVNNNNTDNSISFRLSNRKSVQVNIVGSFEGELADNCHIGAVSFEPAQITLTGPEYYLNNVSYALFAFGEGERIDRQYSEASYAKNLTVRQTETVSSENDMDKTGYQLILKNRDNDDYNNSLISYEADLSLSMPVYRTESFRIELDDSSVKYSAGATRENTAFTISPSSVELSGIPSEIEDLEKVIYLTPKFDTKNIIEFDEEQAAFVSVRTMKTPVPDKLRVSGEGSEVTLTIAIKDLIAKDFTVTKFRVANPPPDYETRVLTTSITVTLRGPADILDAIRSDQIVAEVDMKGRAPANNPIYSPEIIVSGYEDQVGTIGKVEQVSIAFDEITE